MIKIIEKNDSKKLYQWDLNREIVISADADVVDFAHKNDATAVRVKPVNKDGVLSASIPNSLLRSSQPIVAWLVKGDQTLYGQVLPVIPRQKPAEYVETEDDVLSYVALEKRVADLEKNTGGIAEETDPTVPDWAKAPEKPTYTAAEVGAMPKDAKIPTKTSELENDSGFLTSQQKNEKYVLIQGIALEEPVAKISISADMEGNPFNLSKIRMIITGIMPVQRLNVSMPEVENNYYYYAFSAEKETTAVVEIGERLKPENVCIAAQISGTDLKDASYGMVTSNTNRREMLLRRTSDAITEINLWLNNAEFPSGTRIIVEGVTCDEEVD